MPVVIAFVVFIAQDFKKFLLPLQTKDPMIHLLHPKCMELLKDILDKFMLPELTRRSSDQTKLLPTDKLKNVDVSKKIKEDEG